MQSFRKSLAAAACAGSLFAAAPAQASFLSDMWWKPDESGWGASVVQQDGVGFVTLFVYGPDGEPTWYVAPNTRTVALTSQGLPLLSGPLYKTRGPWFGGAFDPNSVQVTQVGELSIEPTSAKDATFRYRVDGINVQKVATRQTWRQSYDIELMSNYYGSVWMTRRVGNQPAQVVQSAGTVEFTTENNFGSIGLNVGSDRCTLSGPISRNGKFASISGTFVCTNGQSGTGELSEVEITRHGFSAGISLNSTNYGVSGAVAGARR